MMAGPGARAESRQTPSRVQKARYFQGRLCWTTACNGARCVKWGWGKDDGVVWCKVWYARVCDGTGAAQGWGCEALHSLVRIFAGAQQVSSWWSLNIIRGLRTFQVSLQDVSRTCQFAFDMWCRYLCGLGMEVGMIVVRSSGLAGTFS